MRRKLQKAFSVFIALSILNQCFFSTAAYALTGGPTSPEFSSFEPVATTSMVNEFTGDFVYNLPLLNVPGPHGSGYPISLSYHSGTKPEEEAPWVGYGWTLNPGAINRGKKGFADDVNGSSVTYYNKMKRNFTSGYGLFTSASYDGFGINASLNARYNNYRGFAWGFGVGTDAYGAGFGYDYDVTDETSSFSVSLNPANIIMAIVGAASNQKNDSKTKSTKPKLTEELTQRAINRGKGAWKGQVMSLASMKMGSSYGIFGTELIQHATQMPEYTGFTQQYTYSVGVSAWGLGFNFGYNTSYNYQDNEETRNRNTYGYLYSHNVSDNADMMDYYSERNLPYQKDDKHLSMPASNPDMFMVSGEGMGGNFRFYNKNAVQFRPAYTQSTTDINSKGNYTTFGGSMWTTSSGSGTSTYTVGKWHDAENAEEYEFEDEADEAYFARFDNDLGGNVSFVDDDEAVAAALDQTTGSHSGSEQVDDEYDYYTGGTSFGEEQKFEPDISSSDFPHSMDLNTKGRVGRSSYIGYHTNKQINKGIAYNLHNDFDDVIDRSESSIEDGIGEVVMYNEAGLRYNYGLPIYAKNEANMRYGLKESDDANIENNYLVYKDISNTSSIDMVVGEKCNTPYATTFLLTDITTPDYVDRTLDGLTEDDFGGYTKFNYTQVCGAKTKSGSNGWYKWRIPYEGLLYDRGELSTSIDDAAYVMYGEKEVYLLESIETKTHIAKFTVSIRKDGVEADSNEDAAQGSVNPDNLKKLKKLDKIELYTKDENGHADKLLQTVNFQYDYSLSRGLPNSTGSATANATDDNLDEADGRLTLKKVWFDYQGIYNAKISPYEFTYEYKAKAEFAGHIQDKYGSIVDYGKNLEQNPDYEECNIDPWGNYQQNGCGRLSSLKKWVTQNPTSTFDPAAWQLKQIKLPSGGEILVQYEQNDYQYVQNYPAFAMVSLKDPDETASYQSEVGDADKKYYLDVSDIDMSDTDPTNNDDLKELRDYLYDYFKVKDTYKADGSSNNREYNTDEGKNFIFAKFLYALEGETPELSKCNAEYITGYVYVNDVEIDSKGLYIELGKTDFGGTAYDAPMREICQDFVKVNRQGILSANCWANEGLQDIDDIIGVDITKAAEVDPEIGKQFVLCDGSSTAELIATAATLNVGALEAFYVRKLMTCNEVVNTPEDHCKAINLSKSYLKIPLNKGKKGGGVRVKRVLMYDSGIGGNSMDEALYGSEYLYQLENGSSSGVATNEPASIREENGLVQLLDGSEDQDWWESAMQLDKRQVDGPLGESLYPGAQVGYSRVVVQNIHSGETNPGFEVKKFYTSYDYPTEVDHTTIDDENYDPVAPINVEEMLGKSLAFQTVCELYEVYLDMKDIIADYANGEYNYDGDLLSDIESLLDFLEDLSDTYPALEASVGIIINLLEDTLEWINDFVDLLTLCGDCISDPNWDDCVGCGEKAVEVSISDPLNFLATSITSLGDIVDAMADGFDDLIPEITEEENAEYINKLWATQGYSVILNSMNGQPQSAYVYEGSYDDVNSPASAQKIKGIEYGYYAPDEKVSIMKDFASGDYDNEYIGRTQELVMENKAIKNHYDQTITSEKMEWLFTVPSKITNIKSEQELYTHVTNKIIHYPAIPKSVKNYADGVSTVSELSAFSKHNGKAIVSKSYDEFDGLDLDRSSNHDGTYTSYTFPASYEYEEMGQKADNEGFVKESTAGSSLANGDDYDVRIDMKYESISSGSGGTMSSSFSALKQPYLELTELTSDADMDDVLDRLYPGDLIAITLNDASIKYFYIQDIDDNIINLYSMDGPCASGCTAWSDVNLHVLQSSRTNQLNEIAGSLLTYGEDCDNDGNDGSDGGFDFDPTISGFGYLDGSGSDNGIDLTPGNNDYNGVDWDNFDISELLPNASALVVSDELADVRNYIVPDYVTDPDIDVYEDVIVEYIIATAYNIRQDNITSVNQMGSFSRQFYNSNVASSDYDMSYAKFSRIVQSYKTANTNSSLNRVAASIVSQQSNISDGVGSLSALASQLNSRSRSLRAGQKVTVSYTPETSSVTNVAAKPVSVEISKSRLSANTIHVSVNNGSSVNEYDISANNRWSINSDGELNIRNSVSGVSTKMFSVNDYASGINNPTINYDSNVYEEYNCYVLQASATTYDDDWELDDKMNDIFDISSSNPYLTAEKGKWRPGKSWVYNSEIIGGNQDESGERIYKNADVATEFYLFDWSSSNQHSNWANTATVNYYSPNGEAIEDKNMFDVYSCNKFGYNYAVPYLVAGNADYHSTFFESFENLYDTDDASLLFEDGFSTTVASRSHTYSHSGNHSLQMLDLTKISSLPLKELTLSQQMLDDGLQVKFWVRIENGASLTLALSEVSSQYSDIAFTQVARVWDWTLYEAEITDWASLIKGAEFTPQIKFGNATYTTKVWLDDIRIQPSSAEMSCYVYDPTTLRLMTSFDSQHFGLYYQYNPEGKLTRKIVETEKGKRTVEEKHYNQLASQRPSEDASSGSGINISPTPGINIGNGFDFDFGKIDVDVSIINDVHSDVLDIEIFINDQLFEEQYTTDMYIDIIVEYLYAYRYNVMNGLLTASSDQTAFIKDFYTSYLASEGVAPSYTNFISTVEQYRTQYSSSYLNTY